MFLFGPIALLAVLYAWATASFPWLARRRRVVAAALASLGLVQAVAHWLVGHDYSSTAPRMIVELVMMPLVIAALPIGVVRLASWAIGRLPKPAQVAAEGGAMTRRQLVEATSGVALIGATGSMLAWGMVRGRHAFELREVPVPIAGLPRALDGYVIAQISDIHAGLYVGERELNEGLELVRRARPDLVVATGDLVDFDSAWAPMVGRKLVDVAPRDGVAVVPGNHDYYADVDEVADALRAAGVNVLMDEGLVIRGGDGGGFALLGVDDRWSTRYGRSGPQLERALSMVPSDLARVLLSHQPSTVDLWPGQVALQLSGHTHGGQINPGFCAARLVLKYVAGPYQVSGTTLYVNRGFGTVGPPSRVGAPPEVTRFVLVAA
ncbi:MAG TPA: metallophosphoesterase [Polyangiaceae bacterium]|nr:metallophosphoesterase [Polyangiaceae bacterium]